MKITRNLAMGFATAVLGAAVMSGVQAVPAIAGGGGCYDTQFADVATRVVELKNICISPTVVRVPVGTAITWVNHDSADHTVSGVQQTFGNYETLSQGKSVSYRFNSAGVYPYFCLYHPGMVGTVVVGSGVPAAGSSPASTIERIAPAAARVTPAALTGASQGWLSGFASGALAVLAGGGVLLVAWRRLSRSAGR